MLVVWLQCNDEDLLWVWTCPHHPCLFIWPSYRPDVILQMDHFDTNNLDTDKRAMEENECTGINKERLKRWNNINCKKGGNVNSTLCWLRLTVRIKDGQRVTISTTAHQRITLSWSNMMLTNHRCLLNRVGVVLCLFSGRSGRLCGLLCP